jgi:hypothetical protein
MLESGLCLLLPLSQSVVIAEKRVNLDCIDREAAILVAFLNPSSKNTGIFSAIRKQR